LRWLVLRHLLWLPMNPAASLLLTDLYQLNMIEAYLEQGETNAVPVIGVPQARPHMAISCSGAGSFLRSGSSVMVAPVRRSTPATETAFSSAIRTTLV
jgi:hypothetical protein